MCGLAKTAINAESHVSSLCEEIATLARFLTSVDRALRNGHQLQQQFQSPTSLAPVSVDENLWHQSSLALSDCQITLTELGALVSRIEGVVRERKRLWRLRTAVDLKFHAAELEACRAKINKSNWALQMILHAITVSLSLRSNASQDLILLELDRLKSCIDDALQAAVRTPGPGGFSTAVGDQSDARVARHLRDLARAARTFHSAASSTAGSTIRGEDSVVVPWGGNLNREGVAPSVLGSFTPVARERVQQFVHAAAQVRDSYPMPPDAEPEVDGLLLEGGLERVASITSNPPARTNPLAPTHDDGEARFVGGDEFEIPVFEVLEDFAAESMKRQDFDKAAGFLREATQAAKGGGVALSTAVLTRLRVRLAVCYLLQRRRQLAEDVVFTLTQQQKGKLSRPVCNLLHAVALAQLSAYLFEDAITTCKQALQAKRYSLGPKHPDTVEALCLLATAYDMSGNLVYTEATRRLIPPNAVYVHPCDELGFIFGHEELLPDDLKIHITAALASTTAIAHLPPAAELDSGAEGVRHENSYDSGTPSRTEPPPFGIGVTDPTAETALRRQDRLEADTSKEVAGFSAPTVTRSASLPALLQQNLPERRKSRYPAIKLPRVFRSKSQLRRAASMDIIRDPAPAHDDTRKADAESSDDISGWISAHGKRSPTLLRKARPERRNTAPDATPAARMGSNLRGILRWMGPRRRRRSSSGLDADDGDDNVHRIINWMRDQRSTRTDAATIATASTYGDEDDDDNRSSTVDWSGWTPEYCGPDVVVGEYESDTSRVHGDQDGVLRSLGRGRAHVAELMDEPRRAELHGWCPPPRTHDRHAFPLAASTTTASSTDGDARSVFSATGSDGDATDDSSDHEVAGCETHSSSSYTKRVHWEEPHFFSPLPPPTPPPNHGDGDDVLFAFRPAVSPLSASPLLAASLRSTRSVLSTFSLSTPCLLSASPPSTISRLSTTSIPATPRFTSPLSAPPITASHDTPTEPNDDDKDTNPMTSIPHDDQLPVPRTGKPRPVHRPNISKSTPMLNRNKTVANSSGPSSLCSAKIGHTTPLPIALGRNPPLACPSNTSTAVGNIDSEDSKLNLKPLEDGTTTTSHYDNTESVDCCSSRESDEVKERDMGSSAPEALETTTRRGEGMVIAGDGDQTQNTEKGQGQQQQQQQQRLQRTLSWTEGDDTAFWMGKVKVNGQNAS